MSQLRAWMCGQPLSPPFMAHPPVYAEATSSWGEGSQDNITASLWVAAGDSVTCVSPHQSWLNVVVVTI